MRTGRDTEGKPVRELMGPKSPPHVNGVAVTLFIIIFALSLLLGILLKQPVLMIVGILIAFFIGASLKIASQWEKAVVLRLGKFHRMAGPGIFFIIPVVDSVAVWVDQRINATTFNAEQTLTKDTVPVDVDAVLFWVVWDAQKAALEVADYKAAVYWAAQTALRDIIGRTLLSDMLAGREHIDQELRRIIDQRTEPWGVAVQSVEIRDVIIPGSLQDAMSREAQAERERRARIILGNAEKEIAEKFVEAARTYEGSPVALHLRAMNILYEGLKEKGALVVVPSSAVETMGLGTITGLSSLSNQTAGQKTILPNAEE